MTGSANILVRDDTACLPSLVVIRYHVELCIVWVFYFPNYSTLDIISMQLCFIREPIPDAESHLM
ncbi:hypothetical protein C435_19994 [Haloarcula marismortui ATCC 33799]|uniref:Uncharacterized protein n=1 Tax=Haloarcula marismortui ATCC 33799 TaxID=662475 RepID=M0JQE2_9EURY|nr:hypothetical protein C435_19994 [Haloarcula californiae ATCC 33799]